VRVSKQGRRIDISLTVSPIRDAGGRIIGASKIARDITDRKRAEEENARLLADLKEADRRKDEFLAVLAHELRNPLAPIRNAVEIMRAQGPSLPEVQWARDVIDRQIEHMTRLIDDLLDVSRITRGKIELRTERIELGAAMNQAVEAARSLVQCKQHELTLALPPQPIYVNADRTRLAQILGNLLNNACKFMDHGGRIWLTVNREGEQAVIRVKDKGIGIAAEQLPRIFNMFAQLDTSLQRSQSGLGIGLALARQLVELHGGTIEAFSDGPCKGSEFVVRLPVAEAPSEVAQPRTDGDERAAASRKLRILVVDDNRDAADGLGKLLRMMGNEVRTAYDGLQALASASTFLPNVVILDIGLPKLNGYEAGRRIKDELGKDVILIAVTGWGQESDRRRSKEAGFDHHVTKPVEFAALKKLLASLELPKN
jgi:signal transduction histidine kinase/CheY-like chemotaxis protein